MYLCGHPGTGKTSTLHLVLHKLKINSAKYGIPENSLNIQLYNAMSFRDVKKFCQRLLIDLTLELSGEELDENYVKDKKKDEQDLSFLIAK